VLAFCSARGVRLMTRHQKDKSAQFPEFTYALQRLATRARRELVLDGEIVARVNGKPARFQALQPRVHLRDATSIRELTHETPAMLAVFDLLVDGDASLVSEPWLARRKRLEQRLRGRLSPAVTLAESIPNGEWMLGKARASGWEGIMAKRSDAPYLPGVRSNAWLKLKIEFRQEFVVGGWTEPRNNRLYLGALLIGYYRGGGACLRRPRVGGFAGHRCATWQRLRPLARRALSRRRGKRQVHWVARGGRRDQSSTSGPRTALRQPIFLGVRDDKAHGRPIASRRPAAPGHDRSQAGASTSLLERLAAGRPSGQGRSAKAADAGADRHCRAARPHPAAGRRRSAAPRPRTNARRVEPRQIFFPETGHTKEM
jgi:bifunctional non-homologous end joining protein LigD